MQDQSIRVYKKIIQRHRYEKSPGILFWPDYISANRLHFGHQTRQPGNFQPLCRAHPGRAECTSVTGKNRTA